MKAAKTSLVANDTISSDKAVLLHPEKKNDTSGCTSPGHCCSNYNYVDWTFIANTSYDLLIIFITIADIITNLLILYNFYHNKQWPFFWIDLFIIVFTHCGYIVVFFRRILIHKEFRKYPCTIALLYTLVVIFSPLMVFVFFFTSDQSRNLSKIFNKYVPIIIVRRNHLVDDNLYTYDGIANHRTACENTSNTDHWVKLKLRKHVGFLMQGVCESLPQVSCIYLISGIFILTSTKLIKKTKCFAHLESECVLFCSIIINNRMYKFITINV